MTINQKNNMNLSLAVTTGSAQGVGPYITERALEYIPRDVGVTVYSPVPNPGVAPHHEWITLRPTRDESAELTCLLAACNHIKEGKHHALVTGPVDKEDLKGYKQAHSGVIFGHTEILAQVFSAKTCMCFLNWNTRLALVTQHIPLQSVSTTLTPDLIYEKGRLFGEFLRNYMQISSPRIGVCGINPHASSDYYPTQEETNIIEPAIEKLRSDNYTVFGPVSADSAFYRYKKENWDGLISLYHDQSLPYVKGCAFSATVNVTLGLPFVRTSVDHGTGMQAERVDYTNMLRAIEWAILLYHNGLPPCIPLCHSREGGNPLL